jgi:hypothetical protein
MTGFSPQDANLLLILGEVRGDVKGIIKTLASLDANIKSVEEEAAARFAKLDARVAALERIAIRIGGLTVGVGVASGVLSQKLLPAIATILGG